MKKLVFCMFALFALSEGATAQKVTVADVEALPGETVTFALDLSEGQADTYTSLGFDVILPEGITTTGLPKFSESWPAASGSVGEVTSAFASSEAIIGTDVEGLVTISLKVDEGKAIGDYDVTITNIKFRYGTEGDYDAAADATFKVKVVNAHTVVLDENATEAPAAATGVNVKVMRTIKADEWSTIVLPFDMTAEQVKAAFGDDVKLGDFTGYVFDEEADKIQVNFADATAIEANHPYVIKVSAAVSEFSAEGVDIAPEDEPTNAVIKRTKKAWSEMIGTYVAGTETGEEMLILNSNKFWYTTEATKIKAFRAYFDFSDVIANKAAAEARIAFGFNDATGIADMKQNTIKHNVYYTLGGQQVKQPKKGLFIQNGKKVIIK